MGTLGGALGSLLNLQRLWRVSEKYDREYERHGSIQNKYLTKSFGLWLTGMFRTLENLGSKKQPACIGI